MVDLEGIPDPPIRTFLIRFQIPNQFLQKLQTRFPSIDFVVASPDTLDGDIARADAMLAWRLTANEIDAAPNLRWVQWIGAGVDDAPLSHLSERSILLTNNRGVHATNMAEHVLAMMLALARNFPMLMNAQRERTWKDHDGVADAREIAGSRLTIVGAGKIGSALARRADALGMIVNLVARNPRSGTVEPFPVHGRTEIADVLREADHVAVCLPLTPETYRCFNKRLFSSMKRGSFLYNVGRGATVDTDALVAALKSGHLGGAGLDVTDPEPLPPDHELWSIPNVLITAHTAGATPKYWDRAYEILVQNIERITTGKPLINEVDLALGY